MMRPKNSARLASPLRISLNTAPSLTNRMRPANDAANESWVTIMMVAPIRSFIIASVSSMTAALRESSAPVGSSASTSFGSDTMARAAATRWRWPPDIW